MSLARVETAEGPRVRRLAHLRTRLPHRRAVALVVLSVVLLVPTLMAIGVMGLLHYGNPVGDALIVLGHRFKNAATVVDASGYVSGIAAEQITGAASVLCADVRGDELRRAAAETNAAELFARSGVPAKPEKEKRKR